MKNTSISTSIQQQPTVAFPRRGKKANRRLAEQVRESRRILLEAAQLAEEEEAQTVAPKDQARVGHRPLYDLQEFAEKLEWVESLEGDSKKTLLKSYEQHQSQGAFRRVAEAPAPEVLQPLKRDFPNFVQVTELIERRLHLCRMAPEKLLRLPPILLNGPPGVGKTAYCKRLSELLEIRFEQIDLSSGGVDFTITGLDSGYSSGRPGRVWDCLKHECISVLWLLDEIDKPGNSKTHSSINYLLGLLEPVSARRFIDNAALLPLDASWLCYIATSNDIALIDKPILSRFEVFTIPPPSGAQMLAVVGSIFLEIQKNESWADAFDAELTEDVIKALSTSTPREIRRGLVQAHANAAAHQRKQLIASDIPQALSPISSGERRIGFV